MARFAQHKVSYFGGDLSRKKRNTLEFWFYQNYKALANCSIGSHRVPVEGFAISFLLSW